MSNLVAAGAPGYSLLAHPQRSRDTAFVWGRYYLCEAVACGPDDECFVVLPTGLTGFDRYAFLRRFPEAELVPELVEALKRCATINHHGIEQLYDIAIEDGYAFTVSQFVGGTSLATIASGLRHARFDWPLALALFCDALSRLAPMREAGIIHGDLTRARLRLAYDGTLYVCHGLPRHHATVTWGRAVCSAADATLSLAATAEDMAVLGAADGDIDALAIACDALIVRHPELDPILPALVLAARDDGDAIEKVAAELAPLVDTGPLWRAT